MVAPFPNYVVFRRARQTGSRVGLYNSADAGIDGHRWATVCEDHEQLVTHDSYAVAASWVSYPAEWCSVCRERLAGKVIEGEIAA